MNMIFSEQKIVFQNKALQKKGPLWLLSGITKEEEEDYLNYLSSFGWKKLFKKTEKGWLFYLFDSNG